MHADRRVLVATRPPSSKATAQLLDFVANQAAWWWCVLLVRSGETALSLAGPLAYVVVRAAAAESALVPVVALALAGAAFGAVGDQLLAAFGLIDFGAAGTNGGFMVALWAMFAVSLMFSNSFVVRLPAWQRALAGAAAGPLAYLGGERLGVLALAPSAWFGVAVEWAVALTVLPLLVRSRAEERS